MLYMTTTDERHDFDFTYITPDDELHIRLSLQVLECRSRGEWRLVNTFSTDAELFALRESGLLRLKETVG